MRLDTVMVSSLFFIHNFDSSPVMSTDIHASFVTFNGEVGGRANGDLISRSYGCIQSPWTNGIRNAYYVRPAGDVNSGSINGVDYSYGNISPNTDWYDDIAWYIWPEGNIDYDGGWYVDDSYGIVYSLSGHDYY